MGLCGPRRRRAGVRLAGKVLPGAQRPNGLAQRGPVVGPATLRPALPRPRAPRRPAHQVRGQVRFFWKSILFAVAIATEPFLFYSGRNLVSGLTPFLRCRSLILPLSI